MSHKLISIVLVLFSSAVAFAGDIRISDCISKAEMQEIASHFDQFKNLAQKDYCYDGSQTANLLQAIMFMRKTQFSADMKRSQDDLFSGRFAKDWYQYFIGRISDINVQSSCPKGVGAYVYGWGSTMYVCPMMLTETFSALDRASVFMHEARHIDGYPHTTCRSGARQGLQGACDTKISEGGSYAVSVETYAQIAKYATDLHPALKAYAMNSAVTYADEAFDTPARVQRQEQLLIMAENKDFLSYDTQKNVMANLGSTPDLGKLVPRAQHLILFPVDRSQNARYVFTKNEGEIVQSAGEAVIEYNSQNPKQRDNLKDLHIGGQWVAKVYSDKIEFTCNPKADTKENVNIPRGRALSLLYINGYARAAKSTHLLTDTGDVLEIGCGNNLRAYVKNANITLPGRYTRVHKSAGRTFGLSEQGEVFDITSGQAQKIDLGNVGKIFEIAPRQTFNFLDAQ